MAEAHGAAQELRHSRTGIADDLAAIVRRYIVRRSAEPLPAPDSPAECGALPFGTWAGVRGA